VGRDLWPWLGQADFDQGIRPYPHVLAIVASCPIVHKVNLYRRAPTLNKHQVVDTCSSYSTTYLVVVIPCFSSRSSPLSLLYRQHTPLPLTVTPYSHL
jgi:hypothetical protein